MIDYGDKAKSPSFSTSLKVTASSSAGSVECSLQLIPFVQVLNILQDHYPERLGRAFVINVPFLLNAFYKMLNPFIDPVTREKLKFNPNCVKEGHFESNMLVKENWGGGRTVEYVHEKFWPAWLKLTGERREKDKERWRKLGGKIGVKEWDYKTEIPAGGVGEKIEKTGIPVAVAVQA